MSTIATTQAKRIFVVVNPKAGSYAADAVRGALDRYFPHHLAEGEPLCEIHETGHDEKLVEVVREARDRGFDLVVAAGGDGTVSGVADGLVGSEVPLGIIPLGTANVLARELGIPVDLEGACQLLASAHTLAPVDAMQVGDHYYFTQVGVGIDSLMIRDTKREHKQRFGRLAYLWTAFWRLLGFQPRRFRLTVDGANPRRPRATQVLIANSGILGQPPFRWGPDIRPDDGRLDLCVIRARTLLDYLILAWHFLFHQHRRDPNVRYQTVTREVIIETKHPLPVQADGEIVGETPVEIRLVPRAVRVVILSRQS